MCKNRWTRRRMAIDGGFEVRPEAGAEALKSEAEKKDEVLERHRRMRCRSC